MLDVIHVLLCDNTVHTCIHTHTHMHTVCQIRGWFLIMGKEHTIEPDQTRPASELHALKWLLGSSTASLLPLIR